MKEKKIKLHNLIFIYIITTIIVTVFSFSKYVTTVSRDNKAQLAAMATNMSVNIALPSTKISILTLDEIFVEVNFSFGSTISGAGLRSKMLARISTTQIAAPRIM